MENEIKSTTRKWWAVPYNFLIWKDGQIVQTRPLSDMPWATLNWHANKFWIQIALIWNFNVSHPTEEQKLSLNKLIKKIDLPIKLHREVGATACPWKYFEL